MIANLTPYAAAKVTNIVLANEELNKVIKPQMLYTYAKKNIIETTTDETGKVFFVGDAFKAWLDKYVEKVRNGESTTRTDYSELASQFMNVEKTEETEETVEETVEV
jgi:hypothetical protein